MNTKMSQIIEILGNMTVEEKEQLSSLLSAKPEIEDEVEVEIATPSPVAPAPKTKSIADLRAKGMKAQGKNTQRSNQRPFGVTKSFRRDGSEYNYIRSRFDGLEGKIPEEFTEMKEWLITFSSQGTKAVDWFHGAGPTAITLTSEVCELDKEGTFKELSF